jgi:PAS domain S-box-containing protein
LLCWDHTERIQYAAGIQPPGLALSPEELIGQSWESLFPAEWAAQIRLRLDAMLPNTRASLPGPRLLPDETPWPAVYHRCGSLCFLELLQPGPTVPADKRLNCLQELITASGELDRVEPFAQRLVDHLRDVSGYERVLVYRFDSEGHGQVIAESRVADLDPLVGLSFPASDIPAQARKLYQLNRIRLLVDAQATMLPLLAHEKTTPATEVDLSLAVLRSMSVIHCEYLRNLGVRSTLVGSILSEGKLWGLIACHHRQPQLPCIDLQDLVQSLCQLLTQQIAQCVHLQRELGRIRARQLLNCLSEWLLDNTNFEEQLLDPRNGWMEMVGASGMVILYEDKLWGRGEVPPESAVRQLTQWLQARGERFFATSSLGAMAPEFTPFAAVASGLIALACTPERKDWLLWFRPEQPACVHWAGDPSKGLVYQDGTARLTPRTSFAEWLEQVSGRARPWESSELALIHEVVQPNLIELLLANSQRRILEAQRDLQLMRRIVESTNDAILITHGELRPGDGPAILYANPAFLRETGYTLDEIRGRSPRFLQGPDTSTDVIRRLIEASIQGNTHTTEILQYRKDGSEYWADLSLLPIETPSGVPSHWIAIQRNITDRKRAQRELAEREASLRLILEQMPLGCLTYDTEGYIRSWNPTCERIFGWAASEILGRSIYDTIVPEEAADYVHTLIQKLGEERRSLDGHNRNRTRSGSAIWCRWNNSPLIDSTGKLVGFLSMAQDVTQLHEATLALEESNRRYELLANTILDVVSLHRPDGQLIFVTPSTQRLTGFTPEEWATMETMSLIHPEDLSTVIDANLRNLAGEVTKIEWRCRHKEGGYVWLESVATPTYDVEGQVTSLVCCSRDITERKRAESARLTLEEQLRQVQKLEAVGQLAGGVAHDFNNLLTVIVNCTEMLLHQVDPRHPDRPLLEDILGAAERGSTLTRQLLTFSRQQIVQKQVIDLNPLVASICGLLSRLIGEHITLRVQTLSPSPHVEVDRGQFEQILMNLMVNARDAMPDGGTLTIRCESMLVDQQTPQRPLHCPPGPYARLSVQDTGLGMTSEVRSRLFEPFFTTKPVGRGTGLGLATVHGIVSQSKGFIAVHSEPGQGSLFEVYLPRIQPIGCPSSNPPVGARESIPGKRILLVEDNHEVRNLTATILRRSGFEVILADTPAVALDICQRLESAPDMLLTDVVMPGMSGRQLMEQIRRRFPGLRVGFVSGYTADMVLRHGIEQEQVAFLQKPYSPETLTRFVHQVLQQS